MSSVRVALVSGFRGVAEFHAAAGNLRTAELMREHAEDVAKLERDDLACRAPLEADLLVRCATHAPFRGGVQ
jgi:hypothetical protein